MASATAASPHSRHPQSRMPNLAARAMLMQRVLATILSLILGGLFAHHVDKHFVPSLFVQCGMIVQIIVLCAAVRDVAAGAIESRLASLLVFAFGILTIASLSLLTIPPVIRSRHAITIVHCAIWLRLGCSGVFLAMSLYSLHAILSTSRHRAATATIVLLVVLIDALVSCLQLAYGLGHTVVSEGILRILGGTLAVAVAILPWAIDWRSVVLRSKVITNVSQCTECGYSLVGLPHRCCPECGYLTALKPES